MKTAIQITLQGALLALVLAVSIVVGQSPLQAPAALPGGSGQSGCIFDFTNTTNQVINIDEIRQAFMAAGTHDMEVWTTPGSGLIDPLNTGGQWVLEGASTNVAGSGPGTADPIGICLTGGINTAVAPGATVGIYVTSTTGVVSYSLGVAVGTTYASNADCTVQSGYGGTYPFGSQFFPRRANVEIYYTIGTALLSVQLNTPNASFDINGAPGTGCTVARAMVCGARLASASMGSILPVGTGWDLVIQTGPALVPGIVTSGNIINLDETPGTPFLLSTGLQSLPPGPTPLTWPGSPSVALPFTAPVTPGMFHAQGYFVDPSNSDGITLTAAAELDVVGQAPLSVALGDDTNQNITLAQVCAPMQTANFYGTQYTQFFIHSNGEVTFTTGATDFTPTVGEFDTQFPRISGMWTDLTPQLGGTVTVVSSTTDLRVSFSGVPSFGVPTSANSFDILIDAWGGTTIANYIPASTHSIDTIIGISNGMLGTAGPPISYDGLVGSGVQTSATTTNSVFEFAVATAVPNTATWSSAYWPASDSSSYTIQ